jgi:hypothetical protein
MISLVAIGIFSVLSTMLNIILHIPGDRLQINAVEEKFEGQSNSIEEC